MESSRSLEHENNSQIFLSSGEHYCVITVAVKQCLTTLNGMRKSRKLIVFVQKYILNLIFKYNFGKKIKNIFSEVTFVRKKFKR